MEKKRFVHFQGSAQCVNLTVKLLGISRESRKLEKRTRRERWGNCGNGSLSVRKSATYWEMLDFSGSLALTSWYGMVNHPLQSDGDSFIILILMIYRCDKIVTISLKEIHLNNRDIRRITSAIHNNATLKSTPTPVISFPSHPLPTYCSFRHFFIIIYYANLQIRCLPLVVHIEDKRTFVVVHIFKNITEIQLNGKYLSVM